MGRVVRRLASGFITVWLMVFVPSFIIWGLIIRANTNGIARFRSVWDWCVDKLAYPLIVSPIANPSWDWLKSGSSVQATLGFVILVACWAAILAAPPVLIIFWWRLAAARMNGSPSDINTSSIDTTAATSSPFAPIYILTLPIAIVYHAVRKILAFLSPVAKPAVKTFVIAWLISMCVIVIYFWQVEPWKWPDALTAIRQDGWEGYLDYLHIPRLFNRQWYAHWNALWAMQTSPNTQDRLGAPGDWHSHRDLWFLMVLHATRHAIAPTILVAVVATILQLFRLGGEKT